MPIIIVITLKASIPSMIINPEMPQIISAFVNMVPPVGIEPTLFLRICLIKTVPNHSAKEVLWLEIRPRIELG